VRKATHDQSCPHACDSAATVHRKFHVSSPCAFK
jgi:hypothetical protein